MNIARESERQFYLGRMGIRLWYARSAQPGAAPSPDFNLDELPQAAPPARTPVSHPGPRGASRGVSGIANLRGLIDESGPDLKGASSKVVKKEQLPSVAETAASAPVEEHLDSVVPESFPSTSPSSLPIGNLGERIPLNVNWGIWTGERHVLVSAISTDASMELQQALARNILAALGAEAEKSLFLQWPVFRNAAVPGNDEAGLSILLQDLRREFPPVAPILLGLCQGEGWADRAGWIEAALGKPLIDFEHSLATLATDAGRKRALWSRLRPAMASHE